MSVWLQVYILATMLIWGMALGIVFDIYKFLLPTSKIKGITQYIFDTVFWLVITIVTFMIMVFANFGEVRIYLILGIAFGFTVYSILLSKWVIKFLSFMRKIILGLAKIVKKILKLIFSVCKKLYEIILKIIIIILYPFIWILSKIFHPLIKLVKKVVKKIITRIKRK